MLKLFAKTYKGLEGPLADELKELGATGVHSVFRGVYFEGDKALMYRVLYSCRTALRILQQIAAFEVNNDNELYEAITHQIPWEDFFSIDQTFAIDAVLSSDMFTHSQYAALKAKDGIVDRFRNIKGGRPNVDVDDPDYRIHLHIFKNKCSVYFDASGSSLHMRNYRKNPGLAPLSEVLAAGLIDLSHWDQKTLLVDPMCGSGTLLIEAAMKATHWPAQYFRTYFGCKKWNDFDPLLWEQMREEANGKRLQWSGRPLLGFDRDAITVRKSIQNLISAGMYGDIKVEVSDFHHLEKPGGKVFMITNPPYDERVKLYDANRFYQDFGDTLKKNWAGTTVWILLPDSPAVKSIGLRPSAKISLMNGPIPCHFTKFELYEGSRNKNHR